MTAVERQEFEERYRRGMENAKRTRELAEKGLAELRARRGKR
ncbi:MAG TPA: hypothetical protein VFW85_03205 [Gaiellaceae bacterium]|nr:hypothetical protein [Gaiellaceae bacterium]